MATKKTTKTTKMRARPTFNHTRADGPYNPCNECLERMSAEELRDVIRDMRVTRAAKEIATSERIDQFNITETICKRIVRLDQVRENKRRAAMNSTHSDDLWKEIADLDREVTICRAIWRAFE